MSARVILFGATGYTGRLAAHSMVRAGLSPVLAGRSASRLAELVDELAALGFAESAPTWQVADVSDPASVQALVTDPSDVLVSTVGPFTSLGDPAISAAIRAGAAYVDSTGEPPFIGRVFTDYHRLALGSGARLLTAFGYDYVPGNLAGALAIASARASGSTPVRVEIGYFVQGAFAMS
ncbi:MAG: saccharopine dehydrogenase NADP-binding domain-containing protein, partial [Candidatus Nanopelagicales bacterium]